MSDGDRPTPEQMLARLQAERAEEDEAVRNPRRGRLKVYFGYAPGVGKTYAMLQEARRLHAAGREVVVGYVEAHGRPETESLLEGLERLPTLPVAYGSATMQEFDLDGALARRPQIILVDELAHANAPTLRHAKRWQDVEELLDAGIDVHSTCNVQHVESLNDVIAGISGVTVRETVPDEVFERADEIALIDLPPESLLERLSEGKVYVPTQAQRALSNFFKRENLVALRELALRRTAERVHVDVALARRGSAAKRAWATKERLLVGVSASPSSAKVLRSAKRLADSLDAEWIALHVDSPTTAGLSPEDRSRLVANLRLAERLGAETETVVGEDLVDETVAYARRRNVTKIVIGKTDPGRRKVWGSRSVADRLLADSGDIDVFVVRGIGVESRPAAAAPTPAFRAKPWVETTLVLAASTLVALGLHRIGLSEANLVMTFLLGVVVVAFRYGRWPAVVASVTSVLLFDIVFTAPYFTVAVYDLEYLLTFAVMLFVGMAIAAMATRARVQTEIARRNETRTAALYRLGRKLAGISGRSFLAAETERAVAETFDVEAVVFLPENGGFLRPIVDHRASFAAEPHEAAVAQWAFDHDQPAGRGTDTLPSAKAMYLPLTSPNGTLGALGVRAREIDRLLLPDARQLLEAFAAQTASALERDRLTLDSESARVEAETERLRGTLLASVSHDLRTPLAVISGASSSLIEGAAADDSRLRRELLESIHDEAGRLSRLVENVLRYAKLSSGKFHVEKEWHPLEEIVGSALGGLESTIGSRPVEVDLPDEMLLVNVDAGLIEQTLTNLIENACRYSPAGTPLAVSGRRDGKYAIVEVSDRGPGVAPEEAAKIFGAFERGTDAATDQRGSGLGLAICKAIVEAHGGRIEVVQRTGGGSTFRFRIPGGIPPATSPPDERGAA